MAKWFEGVHEGKETQTYVREQGAWKRAVGEVRGRRSGVVEAWVSEAIGVLGGRKKDEGRRERQELGNTRDSSRMWQKERLQHGKRKETTTRGRYMNDRGIENLYLGREKRDREKEEQGVSEYVCVCV